MSGETDHITLDVVLEAFRAAIEEELHVALPGRIVSFDATTQMADIDPLVRRSVASVDGSRVIELMPTIRSVPILFPGASNYFFRHPLVVGDTVLLIFCERDFARWHVTGELSDPIDLRQHHLAHAVAIPGFRSRDSALPAPTGNFIEIGKRGGIFDFVALATKIDAAFNAFVNAVPVPNDGGAAIQTAVKLVWPPSPANTSCAAQDVKAT